jgi:hypothetical protein
LNLKPSKENCVCLGEKKIVSPFGKNLRTQWFDCILGRDFSSCKAELFTYLWL